MGGVVATDAEHPMYGKALGATVDRKGDRRRRSNGESHEGNL
jgi:hypothetical protein